MPLTHVRTFRVRHYECDAYGHVNHANYLRYMQEAAIDASAAAGYDQGRYLQIRHFWLIRETQIEYLRPLRYGESVHVTTWVADFRRARSRRAYEFHLAGSKKLVARASTDWVFLEQGTNRPASIPTEMKAAFYPEGLPDSFPNSERFPKPPPRPSGTYCQNRRVEWRDLDAAGHANNATYLSYIEDCGLQMVGAHGWNLIRMAADELAIVARSHRIEYKVPATLDDSLEIATWVSDVQDSTVTRHTTISRIPDGQLLARARTIHVWVDHQTGKPRPIPEAFLADLSPVITAANGIDRTPGIPS
jgi:acyl-CoA thioester hydrolase